LSYGSTLNWPQRAGLSDLWIALDRLFDVVEDLQGGVGLPSGLSGGGSIQEFVEAETIDLVDLLVDKVPLRFEPNFVFLPFIL
jgi:hypothetical protein